MKLFKHIDEYQEITITLEDDFKKIIQEFKPESIMAENQYENNTVLKEAFYNTDYVGYGLFYPDLEKINIDLLTKSIRSNPKIILLHSDNPNIEHIKKYGRVVFDFNEYQEEAKKLIYFASWIDDEELYSSNKAKEINFQQVQHTLLTVWNPIGICPITCQDEYDSYAKYILDMLNENSTRQEIYQYLYDIETQYMGLNANLDKLDKTVQELLN